MGHPKHTRLISVVCTVLVAIMALVLYWPDNSLTSKARRKWKDQAIATISNRLNDQAWRKDQISRLQSAAATRPFEGGWVSDDLLVTRNGDWILCRSVCPKEQNTSVGKDLFIGYGSDGRWYYSTFHFCVQKIVLKLERQPDSLSQLVDGYWLVPFDGKSDDCLKTTWESGPYGDAKLQAASAVTREQTR